MSLAAAPHPSLVVAGYDLRAIMVRAVGIARMGGFDQSWPRRMIAGLRFAWSMAKVEMHRHKVATGQVPAPKLRLDRKAAFVLLGRMQDHVVNRGRHILAGMSQVAPLGFILDRAREEYRRIPAADRERLLAGLQVATVKRGRLAYYGHSWGR